MANRVVTLPFPNKGYVSAGASRFLPKEILSGVQGVEPQQWAKAYLARRSSGVWIVAGRGAGPTLTGAEQCGP